MSKIKLGIIGTGVAARQLHWPALQQLTDKYEIVALANRTKSKAVKFAKKIGLATENVYQDYEELLDRSDVEVVDLALPPRMNYEVASKAASQGKDVICEKPISTSLEDAEKMLELQEEYGIQLLVAENFRYEDTIQFARDFLSKESSANPFLMTYQWMQPVGKDDEIASRPWRENPEHASGFLLDHGVHMIDVVRYLMGEIDLVHTFGRDLKEHLGGVDTAIFNLKFESGDLCSVNWSFASATERTGHIQLWAPGETLIVSPTEVSRHQEGSLQTLFESGERSSFYREFEDFYYALREDKEPEMRAEDAYRDLCSVLAASESAFESKIQKVENIEQR